jgi:DNA-binding response OmpR family regulator
MASILIAEDDPDIRRLLGKLLALEGHEVAEVADGEFAMDHLRRSVPDLVVLDVMMPRKDGLTVLNDMKKEGIREKTKVMLLTAKNSESDWLRGYKAGADGYVPKPFDPEALILAIDEILEMSPLDLEKRRQEELEKAQLLTRLENLFGD